MVVIVRFLLPVSSDHHPRPPSPLPPAKDNMNGRSRYNRNGEDESTEEERFSSTDDGEYDDDGDDEGSSGYYDDDDDDDDDEGDEMQAFISPAQSRKAKQAKWALLRKESRLKPLEILHTTTARRIAKAMHPHDDVPDSCGCRLLYLLVVLGLMWGAYCWSGYEMSSDSVIQAWHQFRLRDIKHWCLDVSMDMPLVGEDAVRVSCSVRPRYR